jgi:hypothetical protein
MAVSEVGVADGMKAYGRVDVKVHTFMTSTSDEVSFTFQG